MFDLLGLVLLLLLASIFAGLTWSARRARLPLLRWLGGGLAGLLALATTLLLGTSLFGYWKLNRSHDNPLRMTSVEVTAERVARGERFAPLCGGCHAAEDDGPLTGRDFLDEGAPPIGRFHAPNLTPTHLAAWSDGEIVRAIREGVHRSGRSLLIMPSSQLRHLSDEDVQGIVAYLRSLEARGTDWPPNRLNVLGAILVTQAPIFEVQAPISEPVLAPARGPTAAFGSYLASLTCEGCHGANLLGDGEAGVPPLLSVTSFWGESRFIEFMRTGVRPGGTEAVGEQMPWKVLSRFLSDDDLRALYLHVEAELEYLAPGG